MRQKLATERSPSTRAKDDVNRLTVAAHELGRLNLQTQELAKAIQGVVQNIRSMAASCQPTPIPPLFAEGGTSSSEGGFEHSIAASTQTARECSGKAGTVLSSVLGRSDCSQRPRAPHCGSRPYSA